MEQSNQTNSENHNVDSEPTPSQNTGRKTTWHLVLFLALLVGACSATYIVALSRQDTQTTNSNSASESDQGAGTPQSTYSISVAKSHPLSIPGREVRTKLVLPLGTSIIQFNDDIENQRELVGHFTNSYNDLLGKWIFAENKRMADGRYTTSDNGHLYISAVEKWLTTDDPDDIPYAYDDSAFNIGISTLTDISGTPAKASDKQAYVDQLIQKTTECVKGKETGFVIAKTINVCYWINGPRDGDSSLLNFIGYGTVDDKPVYLNGFTRLYDFEDMSRDQRLAEVEKYHPKANPRAIETANSYIDALKQTTITTKEK